MLYRGQQMRKRLLGTITAASSAQLIFKSRLLFTVV